MFELIYIFWLSFIWLMFLKLLVRFPVWWLDTIILIIITVNKIFQNLLIRDNVFGFLVLRDNVFDISVIRHSFLKYIYSTFSMDEPIFKIYSPLNSNRYEGLKARMSVPISKLYQSYFIYYKNILYLFFFLESTIHVVFWLDQTRYFQFTPRLFPLLKEIFL